MEWLEKRCGAVLTRMARAVVAEDDDRIVGMVAVDSVTLSSAQVHMAVERSAVWHRLLRPAFHYIFRQPHNGHLLGLALGVIPEHNARSLRFAVGLGFREAYRIRDGWAPDDDLFLLEMRREECRFLRG